MNIEQLPALAQGGIFIIFVGFAVFMGKINTENQVKWQEFHGRQFEILNETSREIAHVLAQYAQVMAELTRQIEANTDATRRLADHIERGK